MPALLTDHLRHDAHGAAASNIALTYPGQAHFAKPELDRTCRECAHWGPDGDKHTRDRCGVLKRQRCRKFYELTRSWGAPFPHHAVACRHFVLTDNTPPDERAAVR
jgi:hypothetical protein